MLETRKLESSIAGTQILRGADLVLAPGRTVGLIGRNGAGKTTFMRSVMGLLRPDGGEILIDGTDMTREPAHTRAAMGVGYMPEDRRLIPEFTVEQNILLPLNALGEDIDRSRLDWIYELMPEIGRFADRRALALSGGQQKLVALGRALIVGRKLLLLDEPFEGVAPALAQRLIEVIGVLRGEGLSVLLSESDHVHSADLVDGLYVIERGEIEKKAAETA
ncbi:ATP-binding cassette domain-containing protein [Palleronia abyssalis]|uniref:High-affinity branched-chain amino acid transport ATP-binding protein LivF n=1 Tax=Palleronia abyssalis TaxID=1501240 RepID=A0A2R8C051_9RHOB|nr:ATP-binding cassette domain-containing protein [Palleronia abyssalis]SPJ25801.1 High-affinity branched-chain amino acid transport ATP-binding protein LivF [Palleronia abyssalis]